jgi:hypothetical protein
MNLWIFPILSFFGAVVVVQELVVLLKTANELVQEIEVRLQRGDAAQELIKRLATQTTIIERYIARIGEAMTPSCREEIGRLFKRVQKAVEVGNEWLVRADGTELARQNLQRRVSRAYGLPQRNN